MPMDQVIALFSSIIHGFERYRHAFHFKFFTWSVTNKGTRISFHVNFKIRVHLLY